MLPNLGAWTLDKAKSLSAGGPLALGFPLKITVSPDKTFLTVALFTIFKKKLKLKSNKFHGDKNLFIKRNTRYF